MFYGLNYSSSNVSNLQRADRNQPVNSFKQYIWGGLGEQEYSKFGWNLTYIANFNGDIYPDLIIGTPWYDTTFDLDVGMVYIFYGIESTGFSNINFTNADVTIRGDGLNNKFGWDVADAGDVNSDGINDLIVGAPGALNSRGRAYIFYGESGLVGSLVASNVADRILNGPIADGNYGTAVSGAGDIDNDGFDDVIVGAPKTDITVITYGYDTLIRIYPNIWDDNLSTPGIVDFSNGANNTENDTNTWGRLAGDDGWDWIDGITDTVDRVYGHHVTTPSHGTTIDLADCYGPWELNGTDGDNITRGNRSALQVIAGRTRETSNPYGPSGNGDPMTSAAWGIEFNITSEMMDYISSNSSIKVSFNYESWDNEKVFNAPTTAGTEELCTIRSRIWNSTGKYYLGDTIKNNDNYIFYHFQEFGTPEWNTVNGNFNCDISKFIDGAGSYYWDLGSSFGYYDINQNNNDPDEGIITYFDDVSMVITNERSVLIEGAQTSGFGSALTDVGDVNGDGFDDVVIGAPNIDGGYAVLFTGKKRFRSTESINHATIILTGKDNGDKFGFSVAKAGDVDNDGLSDVIIGAPGGDYANLYYGSTLIKTPYLPDLWENIEEQTTPQIEFDSGLKTTGNTEGISGNDDGWDVCNGVYGHTGTAGSSVEYNGANTPNPTAVANDDKLLVGIGAHFGNSAKPDSGAYGVEFSITNEMVTAIEAGGNAVLSFDWHFENLELENDETVWMKTFIRDSNNDFDLGWNLDADASSANKDQTNEIFWSDTPDDMHDVFITECSDCFSSQGDYYLDFGGKVRAWTSSSTNHEDGIFHFDNIYLRINHPPDIQYMGSSGSSFGFSVAYSDKLNFDAYGDIIIGAPYYDSPFGDNSGALFGFLTKQNSHKQVSFEHAEFVSYGEHQDDNLGWAVLAIESLDSDEFTEIVTSAIGYDSTFDNLGRAYIFSITKTPRIRLIYPMSNEFLNGNVTVNATVNDPDNNLDINYGVRFLYSNDLIDWIQIGIDKTPLQPDNIFEHYWNTTLVPDGSNYYVKSWVRDLELNIGENISSAITIDNAHPPEIKIKNPSIGETVTGSVEIGVMAKDSDLDIIGGGIDNSKGVNFYLSPDKTSWEFLGSVKKGVKNEYTLTINTNIYPDDEYWIKVNTSDWDGFECEEIINITIDNPNRPPSIELLTPKDNDELTGIVVVRATAVDFDGDINNSGVTFSITPFMTKSNWQIIGNDPIPEINGTGANIYSISWDTTAVPDSWYLLKAYVMDNSNLTNESIISELKVHNNDDNPPIIELTNPQNGEILKETHMISARVRDLEDNIESHGVDYYYSVDNDQWRYIGTTGDPRNNDPQYYDFLWQTITIPDGKYWLNVTVSDETQLKSHDVLDDPIFIHNSKLNAPFVKILAPTRGQHIKGAFTLRASAIDLEKNIDTNGVLFYFSTDNNDWTVISNVPSPTETSDNIYELSWNTTIHPDGKYWLRAEANDVDGLSGFGNSDYFFIHNSLENPPKVRLLAPNSGEISGIVKVNASVFDLENNVAEDGVDFYYSTDNVTWQRITSDSSGTPMYDEELYYEITWDTHLVPDDLYWLRATADDDTSLIGFDISDNQIIVHNKLTNPPRITFKQPQSGVPLSRIQSITVEVIDFDDDVDGVGFYYSSDNESWKLINTLFKPGKGNIYSIMWNTENIVNGHYYLKVRATDKMGNQKEVWSGPFEVTEGKRKKSDDSGDFISFLKSPSGIWMIVIIVIIIIMALLVMFMLKRSKRREKELLEEVSAELQEAMVKEKEGDLHPDQETVPVPDQTYVPAVTGAGGSTELGDVETDRESYPEQALAKEQELPEKIGEMPSDDLSGSLPSTSITETEAVPGLGTVLEQPAIDDMLPELLPSSTETTGEQEPLTELPPDIDLPPDTSAPPESVPEPQPQPTIESPRPQTIEPQQESEPTTTKEIEKAEEEEDQ
jgi:hypothetical protein